MFLRVLTLVGVLFLISGCATTVVPHPSRITLESALISVGQGLVAMKQAELKQNNDKPFSTGLVVSEAEVAFNIIGSGQQGGKLYVEMSPLPSSPVPIGGKAGGDFSSTYTASRGNQIVLRFRSVAFSKVTTTKDATIVEGPTEPLLLIRIMDALKNTDITTFGFKPEVFIEK